MVPSVSPFSIVVVVAPALVIGVCAEAPMLGASVYDVMAPPPVVGAPQLTDSEPDPTFDTAAGWLGAPGIELGGTVMTGSTQ
jgi:hypothetical protein